jgi:hypothetical protein
VQKGNKVFELGLDDFVFALALVGNGIVANVPFAVYLECKRVPGGALQLVRNERVVNESTDLLFAQFQWVLGDMTLRVRTTIA